MLANYLVFSWIKLEQPWLSGKGNRFAPTEPGFNSRWYPNESLEVAGSSSSQNCTAVELSLQNETAVKWAAGAYYVVHDLYEVCAFSSLRLFIQQQEVQLACKKILLPQCPPHTILVAIFSEPWLGPLAFSSVPRHNSAKLCIAYNLTVMF